MQAKSKYVSSLDLKYLDAKFIAIHDSQLGINTNLYQIRKSKASELPSISKTPQSYDESTLYTSGILPQSRLSSLPSDSIEGRHRSIGSKNRSSGAGEEVVEINRYKKMITKIKKDNEFLHRQIKKLYTQEALGTKQPKKKQIRTILEVAKGLTKSISMPKISPQTKRYQRVYEDLSKQDNPYRKQSLQMQKKFMNNNFHKNFESFLQAHNKRVPQFIKNIR